MALVRDLSNYFLEACEEAAIASAEWRGREDGKAADAAAAAVRCAASLLALSRAATLFSCTSTSSTRL